MPIDYILFDLDDTLYTNTTGLFIEVGDRIEAWVARVLNLSLDDAKVLRREYYLAYGTTMAGLLHHHPEVDIEDYLDYVHHIDVGRYLEPEPDLNAMLAGLPTCKAIFTNAIADWGERVLSRLGVREHFTHIVDVRATHYRGKPAAQAYQVALDVLESRGDACVLLDDQVRNLQQGAAFGMQTVLVRPNGVPQEGVNFAVDYITDAGPILKRLLYQG